MKELEIDWELVEEKWRPKYLHLLDEVFPKNFVTKDEAKSAESILIEELGTMRRFPGSWNGHLNPLLLDIILQQIPNFNMEPIYLEGYPEVEKQYHDLISKFQKMITLLTDMYKEAFGKSGLSEKSEYTPMEKKLFLQSLPSAHPSLRPLLLYMWDLQTSATNAVSNSRWKKLVHKFILEQ